MTQVMLLLDAEKLNTDIESLISRMQVCSVQKTISLHLSYYNTKICLGKYARPFILNYIE